VLAVDPGFRTGCKIAILDEIGNLLEEGVIYPHAVHHGRRDDRKSDRREHRKHKEKVEVAAAPPAPVPSAPEPAPLPPLEGGMDDGPVEPAPAGTTPGASPPEPVSPQADASIAPVAEPVPDTPASPADPAAGGTPPSDAAGPPGAEAAAAAGPPAHAAHGSRREEAKQRLEELVRKHQVTVIAIGNGTACRETEELVSELINERLPELAYVIVNEAGASHYSTSPIGREEFPNFDATLRGTVSIGRRLQDPLSELVKIDPQNIGVGLYQHDIGQKRLKESLEAVIESCVNHVGVDLNTASVPLLRHVSGLNQLTARNLVEYRREHGPFRNREQIKQIPGVGEATFTQAAGFLKVAGGDNPLDSTWIHPESYAITQRLLGELNFQPTDLTDRARTDELHEKVKALPAEETCRNLDIGLPTLHDILESLARPGRDPREDLPKPVFKKGILKLEDLKPGMELKGTVLNVVDFGAFVDVGLKDSGLVHISQLANRYIKSPYEVVSVGDVVTVWVLNVDPERRRVSLTMILPGTERKAAERRPAERKPQEQRQPQERRPLRPPQDRGPRPGQARGGRRPQPAGAQAQAAPGESAEAGQGAATTGEQVPAAAQRQPPRPQQPPRRPHRPKPKPKLTEEALQGNAALRSFAELAAFYEAKKQQ
jgi:uncharacterized protein